jgi:hypothetical protein
MPIAGIGEQHLWSLGHYDNTESAIWSMTTTSRRTSVPAAGDRGQAPHPGWRARRWVVEACHSWLNPNREILICWSKKDENHLALLQLASGLIAFKKARLATLAADQPG